MDSSYDVATNKRREDSGYEDQYQYRQRIGNAQPTHSS